MEEKNDKDDFDEINFPVKFKSPIRTSLFRACKSPLKGNLSGARSSTPQKKVNRDGSLKRIEEIVPSRRGLEISSVIEKFPVIHKNFEIIRKAGEGTFSKVYLAKLRADPTQIFALKHLIPTSSPGRIENELKCLQILGGLDNVLPVKSVLRNGDHIIFILPYVPHAKFTDYMHRMNVTDIRMYMLHLFTALRHVHHLGIIHRDIKPSNFLYSHQLDRYCLIDFGLAMPVPGSSNKILKDYTTSSSSSTAPLPNNAKTTSSSRLKPTTNNVNNCKHSANRICNCCKARSRQVAPRAGTPGFRSPEVLLRHPHQTTAVDMWAAGVILLSILSRKYPFFKAKDDMEALSQMITVFGSAKMKKMADSIDKDFICVPVVEKVEDLKSMCEKLAQRTCLVNKDKLTSSPQNMRHKRKRIDSSEGVIINNDTSKKLAANNKSQSSTDRNEETIHTAKKNDKGLHNTKENLHNTKSESSTTCSCNNCIPIPTSVYNLLERLLELDPSKRISAEQALRHPFFDNR